MPSWLVENPSTVYLLLGIAGLVCAAGWWMNRQPTDERDDVSLLAALQRRRLAAKHIFTLVLLVAVVLAASVWLLNRVVVTDGKRIINAVKDMAAAVPQKDADRILGHISEDFRYGTRSKGELRQYITGYVRSGEVTEVLVDDFKTENISRKDRKGTVKFWFKVKGPNIANDAGYQCLADFVLENDDVWRLKTFKLAMPMTDPHKETIDPPFFH
jgi:hypothetical protein